MHIAIEGMDGVGKTTICKMLAEKLNFIFVEKPLHYLFDSDDTFDNYFRIRDYINVQEDRIFTSWFYGLGNIFLYHKFREEDIVTDRHLVSNYLWSGTNESKPVFDCLVEVIGKPDYTVLLYADRNTLIKRLKKRKGTYFHNDLEKIPLNNRALQKMKSFLKTYKMRYTTIDTTNLNPDQLLDCILDHLIKKKLLDALS